jgi:hypothetical protein
MNTLRNKSLLVATALVVGLVGLANPAGAESLMPETGATSIATTFTDTVADAWPILVALIGMGILIKVVKRFT